MTVIQLARRCGVAAVFALAIVGSAATTARANDPLGACCFANGTCQDLQAVQCVGPGETFIGEGTSCSTIDCAAPVAAPVLSIFGMIAAAGALAALGARRLIAARRGR